MTGEEPMAKIEDILTELVGKAFSIQCTSNIITEEKNKQENAAIANATEQIETQQRERVEKLIISSKKVDEYLDHPDHCGIHMTEFCDCGLREAEGEFKAALKKLEAEGD